MKNVFSVEFDYDEAQKVAIDVLLSDYKVLMSQQWMEEDEQETMVIAYRRVLNYYGVSEEMLDGDV